MEDTQPNSPLERNQVTYQRHRREVFWQVVVPIAAGFLLVATLIYLAIQTTPDQASLWADISAIWLIVPVMTITLLSLVLLVAGIYLNVRLIRILPYYSHQVQRWFSKLAVQISRVDNRAVEPILRLQGFRASITALSRNIRRK